MPALEQDYLLHPLWGATVLGCDDKSWYLGCTKVLSAVASNKHIPVHKFLLQGQIAAKFKGVQTRGSPDLSQLCVDERAVQDRSKLHLILQTFAHRRFSNIHFKSTMLLLRLEKTTVCTGGQIAPDPTILWLTEFPYSLTLAGQDEQLPPSCL